MPHTTPTPPPELGVFPTGLATVPVAPANFRIFVIINHCALLGLLVHALLIPVFAGLQVMPLALFNVLSTTAWGSAFLLNRRARHNAAMLAMLVAAIYIGWDAGFQYYLFLAAPLFYFTPLLDELFKLLIAIGAVLFYIGLHIYSDNFLPLYPVPHEQINLLNYFNIATTFGVLSALSHYYHRIATEAEHKLQQTNAHLETLAGTDTLTGLFNRRRLLQQFESEVYRMRRTDQSLTAVMFDLDDFKQVNDQHGHHVGDRVLSTVAYLAGELVRGHDLLARWGGEEFLLLLPDTDIDGAVAVAEKIRAEIARTDFGYDGIKLQLTGTFGISGFRPEDSIESCLRRADDALYRGKAAGKNCVVAN